LFTDNDLFDAFASMYVDECHIELSIDIQDSGIVLVRVYNLTLAAFDKAFNLLNETLL
jgi:hypothetical protein